MLWLMRVLRKVKSLVVTSDGDAVRGDGVVLGVPKTLWGIVLLVVVVVTLIAVVAVDIAEAESLSLRAVTARLPALLFVFNSFTSSIHLLAMAGAWS